MQIDAKAVNWSRTEDEREGRPLTLLLHGLGSHENDLMGLQPTMPASAVYASLRGPFEYGGGYAWFEPTPDDAARAAALDASTEAVLAWLDQQRGFTSVGLLGFSMGGALAAQLMRHQPERFAFAVNLSGFTIPTDHPGDAALAVRRPPVFWGVGEDDTRINPAFLEYTRHWMDGHTTLTHRSYPGLGHAISPMEMRDVATFMREQLG